MTPSPLRPAATPRRHRCLTFASLVILASAAAGACSGSDSDSATQGAPLPPSPPELAVTLDEYRFDVEGLLPAGRVVFRFTNAGQEQHRPLLLPLTEEIPPIDEQVRGDERRVLTPFAGVNTVEPGEDGTFAVDLEPGRRYALVCLVTGDDGQSHAEKGMTWEARAGVDQSSD